MKLGFFKPSFHCSPSFLFLLSSSWQQRSIGEQKNTEQALKEIDLSAKARLLG
ncbi:hypothetical protein D931_01235 [Enterococcus faecium 13.SD.W.09]|nr:hypothetical protein D931_01235 [Enterococcus faecium 13.SD.W.09]